MAKGNIATHPIPDGDGPVLYVNLHSEQIKSLAESVPPAEDQPDIHLLAESDEIKDAVYNFLTGSKIADLIHQGQLTIRTLSEPVQNAIFTTESETIVPVMGEHSISTRDSEVASLIFSEYESRFQDADSYHFRTPALSKVKGTLREEIGDDTADELDIVLAHADEISKANEYLSIVEIALLLAARNEVLLYDISKWGEDVGLASKATFSRAKSALEDAGLLETEKVPLDIGRPRLRLIAPDEVATANLKTLSSEIPSQL